ncbi:MAG: DUF2007 domain-containing protein [Candidatus Acetothermia bacterium]|jgi:hypothetical protein|nr:DUF2007 domain-containing protein [Candidatus Acetothermia bacterium]MDH7505355.1 DUF2007 domain-containing protein [Candidatus Acetothermia bacterium]
MGNERSVFVFIYNLGSAKEIAFVKMALEGAGIRYYIQGESFYTLMTHLKPWSLKQARLFVEASRAEEAKALLESRLPQGERSEAGPNT